MALFQISNDKITIQVDSMGAELKSLKDVATGREYMWHADPQYWKRTSPVLFPLVGGLKDGVYRLGGQEYPMGQHGFARDMEFKLKSQAAHEIWFTLESDEETLKKYPYPFLLELGYELQEKSVVVKWKVKNPGGDCMHFSIGGHPAFWCPIGGRGTQTEWIVDKPRLLLLHEFRMGVNRMVYNLCAGMLNQDEQIEDCIARELYEETGLRVKRIKKILPPSFAAVAISDTTTYIAFVEVEGSFEDHTSENEQIEAKFYTRDEVRALLETESFSSRAQLAAYFFAEQGIMN